MTTKQLNTIFVAALLASPMLILAQPTAHYCPGSEGDLGSSLPPPGIYLRDYNVFYTADRANDTTGKNVAPGNYNVFVYAQVPRLVWVSETKFLGGNLGISTLLPLMYESVTAGPYKSSNFGAQDWLVDGLLAWHTKQFDFVWAEGIWIPTGDSAAPPTTRVGKGYWTGLLTAGATWWVDKDKTWAVSALSRYEFNTEQQNTHITPGQAYTLEWGISKELPKHITLGIAGYFQQQVTADSGPGASHDLARVAAAGPEFGMLIPKIDVMASLRYEYEFAALGRAQGQTISLTFTKRF